MPRRIGWSIASLSVITACGSDGPPTAPTRDATSTSTGTPAPPNPPPASSTDPIVGRYRLDLSVGGDCNAVPEAARNRTYTADIASSGGANFIVTLSGASFLSGPICTFAPSRLDCNQFLISRSGDLLRFDLINENDDGHGGHIVEAVPAAGWIELIGSASGDMKSDTIAATGSASVWYCPSGAGYPFPCAAYTGCKSEQLRLTFVRQ